jgi:hypothetical protein
MRRRRTLVDRLERQIAEADPYEFDWILEVRLACERQDMEYELAQWEVAVRAQHSGSGSASWCSGQPDDDSGRRTHAYAGEQRIEQIAASDERK